MLLLYTLNCPAQQNNLHYSKTQTLKKIIIQKPGHIYSAYVFKDGKIKTNDVDMTEMTDIIVEFKDKPLFIKYNTSNRIEKAAYQNIFSQFKQDLTRLNENSSRLLKISLMMPEIKREYYKIFFGASVKVPRALRSGIASLDYVKKIFKDEKITANKINYRGMGRGLQKIKSKTDAGKGIVVGIIDTGIDYLHPALGGGIGPLFKVIGGYDFVNNDNDPMDDNGHGTHVAGIIAAKSDKVTGVAPGVSLMAFKVLDKWGSGMESTVIAGIEHCVDPNNDGDITDKVDIANMSLGGYGNPDDPISTAVNNASSLGVTFCIAAGNSWDFSTIGSPGTARSAITVGALDNQNNVADFSSKGPNKEDFSIKPEIVAPGVDIYSAYLNNTYAVFSGTSMATPYVTGVCALVKSLHPEWTPAMIKSAVVNTAADIGEDVMSEGAGKINLVKSESVTSIVTPSTLSFGIDSTNRTTWSVIDTIVIKNENYFIQDYHISITGIQAGIHLDAVPSIFQLPAGAFQQVIITLEVDNNISPNIEEKGRAYEGNVFISGTGDSLRLPWAFVKTPVLIINFEKPPIDFFVTGKNDFHDWLDATINDDYYEALILVKKDLYDVGVYFDEIDLQNNKIPISFVLKENVKMGNYNVLNLSPEESIYRIDMNGTDEKGTPLGTLTNGRKDVSIFFPDSSGLMSSTFFLLGNYYFKTPSISNRFNISCGEFQSDLKKSKNVYVIDYKPLEGINKDITLSNDSLPYLKQNINLNLSPFKNDHNFTFFETTRYTTDIPYPTFFYFGVSSDLGVLNTNVWNGCLFITRQQNSVFGTTTAIMTDLNISHDSSDAQWLITEPFRALGDSIGLFYFMKPFRNTLFYQKENVMIFGKGAVYPTYYFNNYFLGYFGISFYGQLNEERIADNAASTYSLYDSKNRFKASGRLIDLSPENFINGVNRLEITNNNFIIDKNVKGKGTITYSFNYSNRNFNPPNFTSLQIRDSKNQVNYKLTKNEKGILEFSINENNFTDIQNVSAYIKEYNQRSWQLIPVDEIYGDTLIGKMFTGNISPYTNLNNKAMDIKITASGLDGGKTEYEIAPAFIIGDSADNLIDIPDSSFFIPSYELYDNYPNPFNVSTIISYYLPEDAHVQIEIYNILGQHITDLFNGDEKEGLYNLSWNAGNFASGVYIYRLTAKGNRFFQQTKKMVLLK